METKFSKNKQPCNIHIVIHRCSLKLYGEVEMKCTKCGYITWRDDSLTTQELINQMIKEGYPLPDCSNNM